MVKYQHQYSTNTITTESYILLGELNIFNSKVTYAKTVTKCCFRKYHLTGLLSLT